MTDPNPLVAEPRRRRADGIAKVLPEELLVRRRMGVLRAATDQEHGDQSPPETCACLGHRENPHSVRNDACVATSAGRKAIRNPAALHFPDSAKPRTASRRWPPKPPAGDFPTKLRGPTAPT